MVNLLANAYAMERYLEIGANVNKAFTKVSIQNKTVVDDSFDHPVTELVEIEVGFAAFVGRCEAFFDLLDRDTEAVRKYTGVVADENRCGWDLIVISTAAQCFATAYTAFKRSLPYSHENTVWIIDRTIPPCPYSACPDPNDSRQFRELAGIAKPNTWTGDAYKAVLAIHDNHADYSYFTAYNIPVPRTFVWRGARARAAKPVFNGLEGIAKLDYFDLLRHAYIMVPQRIESAPLLLGMVLSPELYRDDNTVKRLTTVKLSTNAEVKLRNDLLKVKADLEQQRQIAAHNNRP